MQQLLALLLVALSQLYSGPTTPTIVKEAFRTLHRGSGVFFAEEGWTASVDTYLDNVSTYWIRPDHIAHADSAAVGEVVPQEKQLEWVNRAWFDAQFRNYDSWKETGICIEGNLILLELDIFFEGVRYPARYWVIYAPYSSRILTFVLVFPQDNPEEFDSYSARLFPALPKCPDDSSI